MASGFGTNGGRNRCFPFFQDFVKCYVQADSPKECELQAEDYRECLHHRKEILRLAIIQKEWEKKRAAEGHGSNSLLSFFTLGSK